MNPLPPENEGSESESAGNPTPPAPGLFSWSLKFSLMFGPWRSLSLAQPALDARELRACARGDDTLSFAA